ncbi:alpha/beta fold hydrolase [Chengkuizengella axinellae]|uniref:Alpha/beta hydrolase n=1 Tax=Chengkuizengella axinellae TaxID=3064388 RepID=A0ABT9J229_9BACL|nr:alpha/beta hydrolase [Chengkuizengella sp. 2205SS18-9]MDP5275628.1 alpha/beta hydrolase [Chengkuizengella sp. 2205SS18-9]
MRDLKVKVNDIDLHVVDYGGSGKNVFCVHGLTANSRYWDAFAERMVDHYHVFAYDIRGRGNSEKPLEGNHITQHASDIAGLIQKLELNNVILVGHSLGSLIGVNFAVHYKDLLSHLILVDGGVEVDPKVIGTIKPALDRLGKEYNDFQSYLEEMKQNPLLSEWNEYMDQYYYSDVKHLDNGHVVSKVSKEAVRQEIEGVGNMNLNELHAGIECPTLLLMAQDCFMDGQTFVVSREKGQELENTIPNSRFVEIEEANHYTIILTKYEELVFEVNRFLNDY